MAKEIKDIYYLQKKREWTQKSLSVLDESDRTLIEMYVDEKIANDVNKIWAENLKCTLAKWRGWLPVSFEKLTLQDVFTGMAKMKETKIEKHDGRVQEYSENHQHNLVKDLKAFLLWLVRRKKNTTLTIDEIKVDIKKPSQSFDTETSPDLITAEELLKLIQYARGTRNKALIATAYETNGRIDEVRHLQWKELDFSDDFGAVCTIRERKTKKKNNSNKKSSDKTIYLHDAVPYLAAWRNEYKGEPIGNALVFPSGKDNGILHYGTLWKILDDSATDSGIAEARRKAGRHKIHWHLLRKSRITNMIKEGYKPSTVGMAAWGSVDSQMMKVYLQLANTDVVDDMRRMAGAPDGGELQQPAKPRMATKCPRCTTENTADADFCRKCAEPLTDEGKERQRLIREQAELQPEYAKSKLILEMLQSVPTEKIAELIAQNKQTQNKY